MSGCPKSHFENNENFFTPYLLTADELDPALSCFREALGLINTGNGDKARLTELIAMCCERFYCDMPIPTRLFLSQLLGFNIDELAKHHHQQFIQEDKLLKFCFSNGAHIFEDVRRGVQEQLALNKVEPS